MRRKLLAWATLAVLVALALPPPAWAQADDAVAERRVKAAYLYRLASYVQWPGDLLPAAGEPFAIGVLGHNDLADDLSTLVADRTVEGRRIDVRRLQGGERPGNLQVLFVARGRMPRLAETLEQLPARGTLVVTEAAGALQRGSAINFVLAEGQVRFEIAPEAAEKRGLKLSSRLVAMAQNPQNPQTPQGRTP